MPVARVAVAVFLLLVWLPSTALARWQTHSPSNMKIELPDDWRRVRVAGDTATFAAPSGGLTLVLVGIRSADDANTAGPAITGIIQGRLENVERSEEVPFRQYGLEGSLMLGRGTARDSGAAMEFVMMAIHDSEGRGLIVFGIAPRGQLAPLRPILDTVQPAS